MSTDPKFSIEFKLLTCATGFLSLSAGLLAPIFAVFVLHLKGDLRHIGEMIALYTLGSGCLGYFMARYSESFKYWMLFVSFPLYAFASLCFLLANGILMLYLAQALLAVSTGLSTPGMTNQVSYHIRGMDPGKSWQFYRLWGKFLAAVAGFAAGHLSHSYGFDLVFIMMISVSLLALLTLIVYHTKQHGPHVEARNSNRDHLLKSTR